MGCSKPPATRIEAAATRWFPKKKGWLLRCSAHSAAITDSQTRERSKSRPEPPHGAACRVVVTLVDGVVPAQPLFRTGYWRLSV
jgi:hypothetical protein